MGFEAQQGVDAVLRPEGRRPLYALVRFGARLHREPGSRQWVLDMPLAETGDQRTCGLTARLLTRLSDHLQDRVVVRLLAPGTRHEFVIRPPATSPQSPEREDSRTETPRAAPVLDDGPLIRAYLAAAYCRQGWNGIAGKLAKEPS